MLHLCLRLQTETQLFTQIQGTKKALKELNLVQHLIGPLLILLPCILMWVTLPFLRRTERVKSPGFPLEGLARKLPS